MLNKLDLLYENIGKKIMNWAKWIFICEAVGAIIAGIAIMVGAADFDDITFVLGIVTILLGPVIAFVSSWLLYAIGQLVDDIHAMRNKEGTTAEVKAKRDAEMLAKRDAEIAVKRDAAAKAREKAEEEAYFNKFAPSCSFCNEKSNTLKVYHSKSTLGYGDTEYLLCEKCAKKQGFM